MAQDDDAQSEETARQVCLRLLEAGPRTREQLAQAMRRKGVSPQVAEAILDRFAEVGLIDDAAFARAWVESRHHGRGLARRALAAELHQRGVGAEEVRAAVGSLRPEDEAETARRLVAKRVVATRGRPLPARARHLVGFLARKGYSAGLAAQVVREALEHDTAIAPSAARPSRGRDFSDSDMDAGLECLDGLEGLDTLDSADDSAEPPPLRGSAV
ncbi:MAG TPA: regulatory protein RecX [Streptosporangiaceae bacterium]|nr:regulatory protein RecX [Streptosporangiaceae bacterium]